MSNEDNASKMQDDLPKANDSTSSQKDSPASEDNKTTGPSISTANPSYQPPKPIMGGVVQRSSTEFLPWTGGAPNVSWTGLATSSPMTFSSPNQWRPTSISSSLKSHHYRRQGIETKFKKGDDLETFQYHITEHLVLHGLDTITYLVDPVDDTKMISCIEHSARLSVENAKTAMTSQVRLYDSYDLENDATAKTFLLNCLDGVLCKQLRARLDTTDTFIVAYLKLIHIIRAISIDRHNRLKERIRARKATDYPGQDLEKLSAHFKEDARELDSAGQYDPNLTLLMLDTFISGGGDAKFNHPLYTLNENLKSALTQVPFMSVGAATKHLAAQQLTYRDICETVEDRYRLAVESGSTLVEAVAAVLRPTFGGRSGNPQRDRSNDTCKNCGKKGHWARDCQAPPTTGRRQPQNGRGRGHSRPGNNNGNDAGPRGSNGSNGRNSWRKIPPGSGQPHTKTLDNGQVVKWCAICKRWSNSHDTQGHTGGVKNQANSGPGGAAANPSAASSSAYANHLTLDPSAWCTSFTIPDDWWGRHGPHAPSAMPSTEGEEPAAAATSPGACVIPGILMVLSFFLGLSGFILGLSLDLASVTAALLRFFGFAGRCSAVVFHSITTHPSWWLLVITWLTMLRILLRLDRQLRSPQPRPLPDRWFWRQGQAQKKRRNRLSRRFLSKLQSHARNRRTTVHQRRAISRNRFRRRRNQRQGLLPPNKSQTSPGVINAHPCCTPGHAQWSAKSRNRRASCHAAACNLQLSSPHSLRAALLNTLDSNANLGERDCFPVIWDSGASVSISHDRNDFVGEILPPHPGLRLQGIAKGLKVKAEGTVAWSFIDSSGMFRTLKVAALFVPEANARLLSTTGLLQHYPDEQLTIELDRLILSGAPETPQHPMRHSITILIQTRSNLPVGTAYSVNAPSKLHAAVNHALTTVSLHNANLTEAEKELLRWHFRLGHISMKRVQSLMRTGVLAHSEGARRLQGAASRLYRMPMCAACQYGKQRSRTAPGSTNTKTVKDVSGALKKDNLFAGQKVSVDHFECRNRGRRSDTYGKEPKNEKYCGGAVFVDHASGLITVVFQSHFNTHETLSSFLTFLADCRDYGVVPQTILSDNGKSFTSAAFQEYLKKFEVISKFAGVGAHHHNGLCERTIGTVVSISRSTMMHAATHWPDTADVALWPFAVSYAVYIFNHMPAVSTGISPHDLFSRSRWPHAKFHDCHVWGCPVYVLDKTISDGKKLPRWKPRSQRGMFLGLSPRHASSVPLVLNLDTGAVTPQFHVIFDDWFATVDADASALPDFGTPEWTNLFGDDAVYQYQFDDDADDNADPNSVDPTPAAVAQREQRIRSALDEHAPPAPLSDPLPPTTSSKPGDPRLQPQASASSTQLPIPSVPTPSSSPVELPAPSSPSLQREIKSEDATAQTSATEGASTETVEKESAYPRRVRGRPRYYVPGISDTAANVAEVPASDHFAAFLDVYPWAAKVAATKNPDILTYDEAMKSPERLEWMKAAGVELQALINHGTFVEVRQSEATTRIIQGTWTFKRKRSPDGTFKKFKARWCARGDQQEDAGDTYSPVVAWSTVRMFLTLSLILGWVTTTVDFSSAFLHAELDTPIWVHLPRGFVSTLGPDTCLRLTKSLYGVSIAPALWFKCCVSALLKLGFKQSELDPCFLYKAGMMLVLYVDDLGIAAQDPKSIDKLITDLRALGFELTREESFEEFLGIKFEPLADNGFMLTQRGLIAKIVKTCRLENSKPNRLPQSQFALGSDTDGPRMNEDWHYSSVVGMLLYLSCNTRPDIAFAVSQVARFSSDPKQSHASAVKTIVRYLHGTRDQGTIFRPTGKLSLDLYVDADFCSLHGREDDRSADAARSRTGFIIFLSNCMLLARSSLQTHISLSTLEAEYSALSQALKTLIPLKRLLCEIVAALDLDSDISATISAQAFEDNQGALLLAQNHRITNRTKYFLVKWHWFWDQSKEFTLHKIESKEQRADFLTKGLPRDAFEHNRLLVQGW